jgi:hypothetical protein
MFGAEVTTQDDADAALTVSTPDLVREWLFATPAAGAVGQRPCIEEAQRRTLPTRYLRAALDHPYQQSIGRANEFCWSC